MTSRRGFLMSVLALAGLTLADRAGTAAGRPTVTVHRSPT
jgi:hypothetical protein